MAFDRFDKLLVVAGTLCCLALAVQLGYSGTQASQQDYAVDKAIEQELAYQAKVSFLQRLYAPVTELRESGQNESALLKLDELSRRYPDEAHGQLLRGEILMELGALDKGIAHLAQAVRMNGDYVDHNSPISRRTFIEDLLQEKMTEVKQRATANPQAKRLQNALQDLYYLQGRLAGGCE